MIVAGGGKRLREPLSWPFYVLPYRTTAVEWVANGSYYTRGTLNPAYNRKTASKSEFRVPGV